MTEAERRAIAYINAMPESIEGCNGSGDALRVCNKLYEFGLDRETAKQIFDDYFNPRCKPVWSDKERDHKLDTAYSKPLNPAGRMLDSRLNTSAASLQQTHASNSIPNNWSPLPLESFPEKTRRFIQEAAQANCVDPAVFAFLILTLYSGIIGRCCQIQLKRGYIEILSIWVALVSLSGTRKTAAVQAVQAPILEYQRKADADFERKQADYERELAEFNRKENSDMEFQSEPVPPTAEQFLLDDITTEAVAEIFENNPNGCLFIQDELSS